MPKRVYIGDSIGVARRIKRMYIGVDNVAKRIKKAYIGIGGVARPCFSEQELVYHGTTQQPLYNDRGHFAATTVGNYALFGGGRQGNYSFSLTVDAYSTQLTRQTAPSLNTTKCNLAATTVGNYALFGGGGKSGQVLSSVEAYRINDDGEGFTKSPAPNLDRSRMSLAATTVGDIALFGGGCNSNAGSFYSVVDVYDASLAHIATTQELSAPKCNLAATTVGNYALFGGGFGTGGECDTVDAFSQSGTSLAQLEWRRAPILPEYHDGCAATTVGNYALFGGGQSAITVTAYSPSLTRSLLEDLVGSDQDYYRCNLAATTVGDFALFGGGWDIVEDKVFDYVDTYDIYLTKGVSKPLSTPRNSLAATTVGNYALFGGGCFGDNYFETYDIVDAYTIID